MRTAQAAAERLKGDYDNRSAKTNKAKKRLSNSLRPSTLEKFEFEIYRVLARVNNQQVTLDGGVSWHAFIDSDAFGQIFCGSETAAGKNLALSVGESQAQVGICLSEWCRVFQRHRNGQCVVDCWMAAYVTTDDAYLAEILRHLQPAVKHLAHGLDNRLPVRDGQQLITLEIDNLERQRQHHQYACQRPGNCIAAGRCHCAVFSQCKSVSGGQHCRRFRDLAGQGVFLCWNRVDVGTGLEQVAAVSAANFVLSARAVIGLQQGQALRALL